MKYNLCLLLLICWNLMSCGLDRSHKYNDDKNFGRKNAPPANAPPTKPPLTDGPEETPPAGSEDPVVPTEPEPTAPLDSLLGHYGYAADFNASSLQKLVKGEKEATLSSFSFIEMGALTVKGFFKILNRTDTVENLDIITKEAGEKYNDVTQIASTGKGDELFNLSGRSESASGTQVLHWKLSGPEGSECPRAFICADRITWKPVTGESWSYCFRNQGTLDSITVPFSPNSQFKTEDFADALPAGGVKVSKPYIISVHPGIVDCNNKNTETRNIYLAQWEVEFKKQGASLPDKFYKFATFQPLVPDSKITVRHNPYSEELKRSYIPINGKLIDSISRFSSSTAYYINSSERVFTKIVKTNQSTVNEGIFSFFVYGTQIDYEFEFCTHKDKTLVPNPVNHCPSKRF